MSAGAIPATAHRHRTIACLGTGNVGSSWVEVFARAGCAVRIWDARPEQARLCADRIAGLYGPDLVVIADSPAQAMAGVCHVQESITEQLDAKRELFGQIEALLEAETVLASSTSAIPASELFSRVSRRENCLVVHPVNPPHLIPLVELSPAEFTAADTVKRTRLLMQEVGQQAIEVRGEIEGFVLNRLQWALLGEALHLVEGGYCTPEEIDLVLTHGLARRWIRYGPFATGHLNSNAGIAGYFGDLKGAMTRVWSSLKRPGNPSSELVARIHQSLSRTMPVSKIQEYQEQRDRTIDRLNTFLADQSERDEEA